MLDQKETGVTVAFSCADCTRVACVRGGEFPNECPTVTEAATVAAAVEHAANDPYACKVMAAAQTTPRDQNGSPRNRIDEIAHFCKEMEFSTVGVAFCIALVKEARVLCQLLSEAGLVVVPVSCKVGGVSPSKLGVDADTFKGVSCNPVAQAAILNRRNTNINIAVGLCLGHDMLFARHSSSPVTTLVVKDRFLGHNTVQALRSSRHPQACARDEAVEEKS